LSAYSERADSYSAGAYVHLRFKNPDQKSPARLLEYLRSKGHENVEVKETEATVEDCFIRLME
jgi:ABC-2 type transport system ATP-binding protein